MSMRTRRLAIVIALSFILAACQSQSLPSRSAEDKTSPASEQASATQEDAASTDRPVEPVPAEDESIAESEELTLAVIPEIATAEIEQTPLVDNTEVKVGLLLPLSGPLAREGAALLDAAQLALFDVADADFMLQPRDTGGTVAGAARAAEDLLAGGATLLLGPLLSEEVVAVTPQARAAGINVVAFSTDAEVAGDGVYLLGHTSRQQIDRLVAFAHESGLTRIAVLAPSTPYGRAVAGQTRRAVAVVGGDVTRVAFYASDASDASEVVRSLANYDRRHGALVAQRNALRQRDDEISKRALRRLEGLDTLGDVPFDALLLPDGGESLRQVVPLLPYYDIDPAKVRFMGTGLWDNSETLGEPTLIGGWFVGPPPEARAGFMGRFEDTYGYAPHRIATLAYDATALAAALARRAGRAAFDADSLASRRGFLGAGGIFRFSADGLAERGLAVLEIIGRDEVVVVSPPPERFDVSTAE